MKKELTTKQQKNRKKAASIAAYTGSFISMAAPYAIYMGVEGVEIFQDNPVKLTASFLMLLMVFGISLFNSIKEKVDKTLWSTIIKMVVAAIICKWVSTSANELGNVLLYGACGLVGSEGLNMLGKKKSNEAKLIADATQEAKKDLYKEKAKKEINIGGII